MYTTYTIPKVYSFEFRYRILRYKKNNAKALIPKICFPQKYLPPLPCIAAIPFSYLSLCCLLLCVHHIYKFTHTEPWVKHYKPFKIINEIGKLDLLYKAYTIYIDRSNPGVIRHYHNSNNTYKS